MRLTWKDNLAAFFSFMNGAWMLWDANHRLTTGDYYRVEGQLGPWAKIAEAIGLDPLGNAMLAIFFIYGVAWIAATILLILTKPPTRRPLMVLPVLTIWYFGAFTIPALIVSPLLLWWADRQSRTKILFHDTRM